MKSVLAAAALALLAAVSARADDGGSAGADLTVGSNGYRAVRARASFDLPDSVYLAPRAAFYRSDEVNGTYKLFGLRGGYEPGRWSFGADAAVQPRVDGYEKSSLGADAAYSFPLSDSDKKAAFDLGGGVVLTRHSDRFAAAGRGLGRGAERTAEFAVRESDLFVFGALRSRAAVLSGRATSSSYDRDLAAANARRELLTGGGGFDAAVFGFPDTILSATLRIKAIPRVEPFVSYTRTTFELGDPPAHAVEAGATVYLGRAGLSASVERYRQQGFADRNYLTLGATLDF